uniref:Uncharacterized protein n=1 Tax=Mola mola TaxID=94237 RepID=A0A3Q3WVC9_MOLML
MTLLRQLNEEILCIPNDWIGTLKLLGLLSQVFWVEEPGCQDLIHGDSHHEKTNYRVMLWYQQPPGDTAMKLIGYLSYSDATIEDQFKEHFDMSGDLGGDKSKNASLTFKVTERGHSAVYYCAAREAH